MDTIIVYKMEDGAKHIIKKLNNVHDYHVHDAMMFNTSCTDNELIIK